MKNAAADVVYQLALTKNAVTDGSTPKGKGKKSKAGTASARRAKAAKAAKAAKRDYKGHLARR